MQRPESGEDEKCPELIFIAGRFFDLAIPEDKEYLFPYFRSPMQRCFLAYYLEFGSYALFIDHSGYYCSKRWMKFLRKKIDILQRVYAQARESRDLSMIAEIKSGRYVVKLRNRKSQKKRDSDTTGNA